MQIDRVDVLVGMQYGSESKGLVADVCRDHYDLAVTVSAANAGHSVRWRDASGYHVIKGRHIPSTFRNFNCRLAIGAGAMITVEVLMEELAELRALHIPIDDRLIIDRNALIVEERHVEEEHAKKDGGDMKDRLGSTREGCGAAWAERVWRGPGVKLAKDEPRLSGYVLPEGSTVAELIAKEKRVLIEGAQGTLLDNIHTDHFPFCTSRSTIASSIAGRAGVPPRAIRHVMGVMRTFPIRVAGNSGPTGSAEVTWDSLSARLGKDVSEYTTVTKLKRRIFEFSWTDFQKAVLLNGPSILALTFLNYINPADEGVTEFADLSLESREFIDKVESVAQAPVMLMSTSADTVIKRPELDFVLSEAV